MPLLLPPKPKNGSGGLTADPRRAGGGAWLAQACRPSIRTQANAQKTPC